MPRTSKSRARLSLRTGASRGKQQLSARVLEPSWVGGQPATLSLSDCSPGLAAGVDSTPDRGSCLNCNALIQNPFPWSWLQIGPEIIEAALKRLNIGPQISSLENLLLTIAAAFAEY